MQKLLNAISVIAHPVFVFPLITALYFEWEQIHSFFAVFSISFLGPFLYFLYLYKTGRVSNFDVSNRKERYKVYPAALIGLLLATSYLYFFSTSEIFWQFLRLIAIATTIVAFNFKIKVSIHAALITLLCLTLFLDFNLHPTIFLLIPLVAYSRYKLKRHTATELLLGTLIPPLFFLI